jgi:hypothetical protein
MYMSIISHMNYGWQSIPERPLSTPAPLATQNATCTGTSSVIYFKSTTEYVSWRCPLARMPGLKGEAGDTSSLLVKSGAVPQL